MALFKCGETKSTNWMRGLYRPLTVQVRNGAGCYI
jgi:hypothetical protein